MARDSRKETSLNVVQRNGQLGQSNRGNDRRNLSADVTRFLPTALRVKREEGKRKKSDSKGSGGMDPRVEPIIAKTNVGGGQQTKDDAYMQFMREIGGLL
uniref:Uncharacterized protein n=2 Tax=Timema TaxID=61471 RepID=A0A7R8VZ32_TIMDO|nr:unnamed protein product [Timema douglasi]